jgi:hypothetical protein
MVRVIDVETLIRQVWSPDVRPLAEEAWRCYDAGAARACIAATWTAVTADIITKLVRMADDGDMKAVPFRTALTHAQGKGLSKEAVRAMQTVEATLLEKAAEFELIDSLGARELERIREDRNLCVHPSLRALGDVYEPRPEVARGHLAIALTTLLTHSPRRAARCSTSSPHTSATRCSCRHFPTSRPPFRPSPHGDTVHDHHLRC